jgi:hypothetical protein
MTAMLPLLRKGIYEVCRWDGLRGGMIYIQSFMKTRTGVQAILSFRHSNLKGYDVGITDGGFMNHATETGSGSMIYAQVP